MILQLKPTSKPVLLSNLLNTLLILALNTHIHTRQRRGKFICYRLKGTYITYNSLYS